METPHLTGAQKTRLRGLGQTTAESAWIGRDGVTPAFLAALNQLLSARELVKVRFSAGQDRHQRAELCAAVASAAPCQCIGAVGHTALFWRPGSAGSKLLAAAP